MEAPKKQARQFKQINLREDVIANMKKLPTSMSTTVSEAVSSCVAYPKKMAEAFADRFDRPKRDVPTRRVNMPYPARMRRIVMDLASMADLSQEETIRLCVEVYLKRQGLR